MAFENESTEWLIKRARKYSRISLEHDQPQEFEAALFNALADRLESYAKMKPLVMTAYREGVSDGKMIHCVSEEHLDTITNDSNKLAEAQAEIIRLRERLRKFDWLVRHAFEEGHCMAKNGEDYVELAWVESAARRAREELSNA